MTQMIERVAQAFLESAAETHVVTNERGDKWTLSWENASAETRRHCKTVARAAIEAMRSPSRQMLKDVGTMDNYDTDSNTADRDHIAWWADMIAAALKERS